MIKGWRDLSVLIVGCGSIGKRHARVLNGLGVRDIRACDPVLEQRNTLLAQVPSAKLYDAYDSALTDSPDTVLICTPSQMHIPMAVEAIEAGCHVLCEKPLSDTTEGVDGLSRLAADQNKKVMVALCFRYHEGLVKAKRYLDSGRVGRLVSVRALMGEHLPEARPDYAELVAAGFYSAFDLMHDLDLAIWYASQPIRRFHVVCGAYALYSELGTDLPDIAEILLEFKDRCVASVHLDFFQRPRRRQMELIGTDGVVIVEFARWDGCTLSVYEAITGDWEHEEITTERDDMFRAEDREFLEAVAEDQPILCTIEEGLKSLRVAAAQQ